MDEASLKSILDMHQAMNIEVFYWWCTAIMFLIHAGFLAYEIGASRSKNALASGMKNVLTLASIIPAFYFVGWWIYNAFPNGLIPIDASAALPWSASMRPDVDDMGTGIFFAAFALFGATTGSILSGAVIERIRLGAFLTLAVILGAGVWILAGAWGWHPDGWMLHKLGYHDVGAAGVVHAVAGFFALGVVLNLGARIGKYREDGTPQVIAPHNMPMTLIGLMLIIVGFFGFLGGCIIFNTGDIGWTTIYGNRTNLSAFAFNTLMGFGGGVIGAYLSSRDPFWTMSGALGGIITVAAGLDLYNPGLAFVLAVTGGALMPKIGALLEKRGVDDSVGAFAVHGFCGFYGVVLVGIFAAGFSNAGEGVPDISFTGQLIGAIVMAVTGFVPGWGISYALKKFNLLRVPPHVEVLGLDLFEVPAKAYPESLASESYSSVPARSGGVVAAPMDKRPDIS